MQLEGVDKRTEQMHMGERYQSITSASQEFLSIIEMLCQFGLDRLDWLESEVKGLVSEF